MSTLQVTTIQSNAAATPPVIRDSAGTEVGQLCRAWVNFNGTGTIGQNQTIRSSFNVSSVSKSGSGDYTVNFTNSFSDANYCVTTALDTSGGSTSTSPMLVTNFASGSVRVFSRNGTAGSFYDQTFVGVSIFR